MLARLAQSASYLARGSNARSSLNSGQETVGRDFSKVSF